MNHRTGRGGEELAKVLWYYNLIPDVSSTTQKIICPFHDDINPSMIVNLADGSWFCFGCNLYGDAIKFVKLIEQKLNKLNDLQAYLMYLRIMKSNKVSGIKLSRAAIKTKPMKNDLYLEAWDYYHGLADVPWELDDLLDEEGLEAKIYMEKRGFDVQTLIACNAKVTYNKGYGLIFPMVDNGKFKGWVCRTMLKAIEEKRKYLYNEGFSRATTLVGDYGSYDYVIVVEGYMDRLKFLQYGVDNVVAILGWKMTQQQIDKLKRTGVKNIISALDNDECGRKGTKYLEGFFKVTRFRYLDHIKDPGDMTESTFETMYRRTMKRYNAEK